MAARFLLMLGWCIGFLIMETTFLISFRDLLINGRLALINGQLVLINGDMLHYVKLFPIALVTLIIEIDLVLSNAYKLYLSSFNPKSLLHLN